MRANRIVILAVLVLTAPLVAALPAGAGDQRSFVVDDDGAQCPDATFAAVQPAIDAADPGDTVYVCGGSYSGDLTISEAGIRLVAREPAAPAVDCVANTRTYSSALAVVRGAIMVAAPDVRVDGLVVVAPESQTAGIFTVVGGSGYWISRNVVDDTPFGIEVESGGAHRTVVERNCVRGASWAAISSQDAGLRNAVIRFNTTVGNANGIAAVSPYPRYNVSITGNTSRDDGTAIVLSGTVASDVTANTVAPAAGAALPRGIVIGGGNIGLVIASNTVTGVNGAGLIVARDQLGPIGTPNLNANVGAVLAGNRLHDNAGSGITTGGPTNLTESLLLGNVLDTNGASGINLGPSNDGNTLAVNVATANARGINLNGAVRTLAAGNTLLDNRLVDARDIAAPGQNTWIGNRCRTDEPAGTLCTEQSPVGTRGSVTSALATRPAVDQTSWPCLGVPVWNRDTTHGNGWQKITVLAPDASTTAECPG